MEYTFIKTTTICDLCFSKTNLGVTYRQKQITMCYKCLSDIYRSIQKHADYLEFKADQYENSLHKTDKPERHNTYFI